MRTQIPLPAHQEQPKTLLRNKAHEIMSEYSFSPNTSRSYGFSPLPNFPQNIDTPSLSGSLSIEPDENCSSSVIEFSSKSKD